MFEKLTLQNCVLFQNSLDAIRVTLAQSITELEQRLENGMSCDKGLIIVTTCCKKLNKKISRLLPIRKPSVNRHVKTRPHYGINPYLIGIIRCVTKKLLYRRGLKFTLGISINIRIFKYSYNNNISDLYQCGYRHMHYEILCKLFVLNDLIKEYH